jgi:lysine 2,3-aminomutase
VKNMFQVPMEQGIEIVENAKRLVSGMDKAVKYCLSHPAGKLEILTKTGEDELLFRFHEAKDPARCGQVFRHRTLPDGCWLPDELTLD